MLWMVRASDSDFSPTGGAQAQAPARSRPQESSASMSSRDVYEVGVRLGDHRRRVVLRLGQAGERQVIAQAVEAILRLHVQRVPAIAGAERDVEPGPAAVRNRNETSGAL